MKVKVAQSCPTLCDPMDYTVRGILQTRILEWAAYPFSKGSSQPWDRTQVSCIIQVAGTQRKWILENWTHMQRWCWWRKGRVEDGEAGERHVLTPKDSV